MLLGEAPLSAGRRRGNSGPVYPASPSEACANAPAVPTFQRLTHAKEKPRRA
jgi:hypothetical protein